MSTCFAPLLAWVLRLWRSDKRQLPLVLDATSLGNRLPDFGGERGHQGLCHSGGLESAADATGRLLAAVLGRTAQRLRPSRLSRVEVIVLADRGLYARWLWDAIRAWGWHPFLRLNVGCKARVPGEETFEWLSRWVPTPGTSWQGRVECFASQKGRVNGTLLMRLPARI